jgi:hypothetical protein
MEWKQDSKSSQDFGDRRTMMRELQRASEKRAWQPIAWAWWYWMGSLVFFQKSLDLSSIFTQGFNEVFKMFPVLRRFQSARH